MLQQIDIFELEVGVKIQMYSISEWIFPVLSCQQNHLLKANVNLLKCDVSWVVTTNRFHMSLQITLKLSPYARKWFWQLETLKHFRLHFHGMSGKKSVVVRALTWKFTMPKQRMLFTGLHQERGDITFCNCPFIFFGFHLFSFPPN